MTLPSGIISAVIETDLYPLRFESFAIDLLSATDGKLYMPTSRNYDRGRDGRSLQGDQERQDILAATTSSGLDTKVLDDIARLTRTTKLASLVYCTSQDVTEHALDAIALEIRKRIPKEASLRMLCSTQLRLLASKNESILRKYYRSEIDDLKQALIYDPGESDSPNLTGLRLALQTQTGDDAIALRADICRRLVLEQLLDAKPRSLNGLSSAIGARLHLPRGVSVQFLVPIIQGLLNETRIKREGDAFALTTIGREYVLAIPDEAATKLLEGKQAIRIGLESLLGYKLADPNFERLWPVFRDSLAELFYLHGASIVRMVGSLQTGELWDDDGAFRIARERLADRSSSVLDNYEQRTEVRQAVIDLFSKKGSAAFDWLTATCAVYVMMCSLGLETASASEVTEVLRGTILVPDTDILLSLLCEGEENHEELVRLVNGWRSIGGTLNAPKPALEEAAYHAWIADHDYANVRDILGTMGDERSSYIIGNAFVRTYRLKARDPRSAKGWTQYIDQFRGRSRYEYSKIVEILREDFSIAPMDITISDGDAANHELFVSIRRFILEQAASDADRGIDELDERTQDKVRRDALLLVTLLLMRERLRRSSNMKTVVAVSSARALRRAAFEFRSDFGQPEAVVSAAAVAALLSLTPGVHMGVGSLRALLFDVKLAKRLSPTELFAYRLLERSDQYELGLSRRVTLKRRLRERLVDEADMTGRRPEEEEHDFLKGDQVEKNVKVLTDALNKMAVPTETVKTIEAQQRRIQSLENEIRVLRNSK